MPAVGSNPYFLLLFSRYADREIRLQCKKKAKTKEIEILTKGGIVFLSYLKNHTESKGGQSRAIQSPEKQSSSISWGRKIVHQNQAHATASLNTRTVLVETWGK